MKTLTGWTTLAALAGAALALSGNSPARGLATVTIIDRDSGTTLDTYHYRGEYWVAGRPGARYAIEIHNRTGGRVLAVTSVDGVNVLSGATAGWDQAGYVFDPDESYPITGWRKSHEEVAAFTFTDAHDSYAGRTGRPANIGVIGVALFRERGHPAVYSPPAAWPAPAPREREWDAPVAQNMPVPAPAPGLQAGAPLAETVAPEARGYLAPPVPSRPEAKLGTGHGAREYSHVADTEFERLQPEPDEVIRIRYDSFENLVAMGVIRRPHALSAEPNPFPGSQRHEFVPDPPG